MLTAASTAASTASATASSNAPRAAVAETHYVDVQGVRIAYRTIGAGSPLVLANRMRGTLDTWDPLFLDALAQAHTVVIFDYPGIGYSEGRLPATMQAAADFVRAFADALGLASFAMGGWSWGGMVTQTLLLESPERVTHGVLIGTNPPGAVEHPIQQRFLDRALKPVNDLADEEVLFFEPASPRSLAAARRSRERIHARPGVAERIPSTQAAIMQYLGAAQGFREGGAPLREGLTQSRTPLLILGGDNDPSTAVQNWYPLVGKIPRGQLIVLPEAGHAPQHQYPELAAAYIREFLARTAD